jgi:hypothetical protein
MLHLINVVTATCLHAYNTQQSLSHALGPLIENIKLLHDDSEKLITNTEEYINEILLNNTQETENSSLNLGKRNRDESYDSNDEPPLKMRM